MNPKKTYKRELALAMLAYYYGMLTAGLWFPEAKVAADTVMIPTFTFVAGAFALDATAKQITR